MTNVITLDSFFDRFVKPMDDELHTKEVAALESQGYIFVKPKKMRPYWRRGPKWRTLNCIGNKSAVRTTLRVRPPR